MPRIVAGALFVPACLGILVVANLRTPRAIPVADLVIATPDFVVYAPSLSALCRSLDVDSCRSAARSSHFPAAMTEATGVPAASLAELDRFRRLLSGSDGGSPGAFDPVGLLDGEWIVSGQWQSDRAPAPPEKLFGTPDLRAPFPYARILVAVRPARQKTLAAIARIFDPLVFERTVRDRVDPALSIANYGGILVCGRPSGNNVDLTSIYRDPPAIAVAIVDDCLVFGTVAEVIAKKRGKSSSDPAIENWLAERKGAVVTTRVDAAIFERLAAGARFFLGDAVSRTARSLVGGTKGMTTITWSEPDRLELTIDAPIAPRFRVSAAPRVENPPGVWATLSIGAPAREVLMRAAPALFDRDDDERFVVANPDERPAPKISPTAADIENAASTVTVSAHDGVVVELCAPEVEDGAAATAPLDAHLSDVRILFPLARDESWPPKIAAPWTITDTAKGAQKAIGFAAAGAGENAPNELFFLSRQGDFAAISTTISASPAQPIAAPTDDAVACLSIDGERFSSYVRATRAMRRRDDVALSKKESADLRDAARRHLIETAKKPTPTRDEIESLAALWTATMVAQEREPRADRRERILDFLADWAPNVEASASMRDGLCRVVVTLSPRRSTIP